jgi:2-oxoglutarate dehydrogenase E1 component
MRAFDRICKDQSFIDFLGNKFGNFKRFGVEGLNSATCALEELVERSVAKGAKNLIFGMAHRGRLNTLHCIFDKPANVIFREFLEKTSSDLGESGDVKYHLGQNVVKNYNGKEVTLTMLPNPSHLEAVDPLVYGSVRAVMEATNDHAGDGVVGVVIHGDAAMSGQGVVYESL